MVKVRTLIRQIGSLNHTRVNFRVRTVWLWVVSDWDRCRNVDFDWDIASFDLHIHSMKS